MKNLKGDMWRSVTRRVWVGRILDRSVDNSAKELPREFIWHSISNTLEEPIGNMWE